MVEPDLLRRKTGRILHHVARLRARQALTAEQLRSNEDLSNSLLMDLQQAIQACIDLAIHVCADERLGSPTGAAEAFALLERDGCIDAALRTKLTGAAGLRNLIVHQYAEIDAARILHVINTDLGDLERFAALIARGGTQRR